MIQSFHVVTIDTDQKITLLQLLDVVGRICGAVNCIKTGTPRGCSRAAERHMALLNGDFHGKQDVLSRSYLVTHDIQNYAIKKCKI